MAQEGFKHKLTAILSAYGIGHISFHRWAKCIIPLRPDSDDTTMRVDRLSLIILGAIKNEMSEMSG